MPRRNKNKWFKDYITKKEEHTKALLLHSQRDLSKDRHIMHISIQNRELKDHSEVIPYFLWDSMAVEISNHHQVSRRKGCGLNDVGLG